MPSIDLGLLEYQQAQYHRKTTPTVHPSERRSGELIMAKLDRITDFAKQTEPVKLGTMHYLRNIHGSRFPGLPIDEEAIITSQQGILDTLIQAKAKHVFVEGVTRVLRPPYDLNQYKEIGGLLRDSGDSILAYKTKNDGTDSTSATFRDEMKLVAEKHFSDYCPGQLLNSLQRKDLLQYSGGVLYPYLGSSLKTKVSLHPTGMQKTWKTGFLKYKEFLHYYLPVNGNSLSRFEQEKKAELEGNPTEEQKVEIERRFKQRRNTDCREMDNNAYKPRDLECAQIVMGFMKEHPGEDAFLVMGASKLHKIPELLTKAGLPQECLKDYPESKVTLPKSKVTLPKSKVTLPISANPEPVPNVPSSSIGCCSFIRRWLPRKQPLDRQAT